MNKTKRRETKVWFIVGFFFPLVGEKKKIKMEVHVGHVGHVNTREDFISLSFEDPEKKLVGKELLRTL